MTTAVSKASLWEPQGLFTCNDNINNEVQLWTQMLQHKLALSTTLENKYSTPN